jgi:HK97 family phage major capsid protein
MLTLKQWREKLAGIHKTLAELKAAAKAKDASPEQKGAYKTALDGIVECVKHIDELEEEERIEGLAAKAAGTPSGGKPGQEEGHDVGDGTVWAVPVSEEEKSPIFIPTVIMASHFKSQANAKSGTFQSPIEVMREEGYGRIADDILKMQARRAHEKGLRVKTNSTLTAQDGGILLPTPNSASIIPFLRSQNTFLDMDPQRIPLIGGRYNQPVGTGSSTAGYVGEGAKKPVGSPTFGAISMSSKKLAGIVMVTEEALKWSLADLRAYITNDLREALSQTMDTALYFGAGSATVPFGILQRTADINTFDASSTAAGSTYFADPTKPTVAELDRIATLMILAITDRNISAGPKFAWLMNYHLQQYLMNARGANGQKIYPEVENGTWKGFRLVVTNAIPNNGGTKTDESILALIDWSNVMFGVDEDVTVRTSSEATIDPGTGVLVSLFQQNMQAILMECRHDIALRRPGAISVLRKARWGSIAA